MKFPLGKIVYTPGVLNKICETDIMFSLGLHSNGIWGDLSDDDRKANDEALENNDSILSSYKDSEGNKFWIFTEWDRSVTTILLPEEY